MKRIAIACVVVVVVVVGLYTGCRYLGFVATNHGKSDVDVVLSKQGGICKADENVDDLGGERDKKITWRVSNRDCDIPQYVTFSEYQERLPTGLGPVDTGVVSPNLAQSKQIGLGGNDKVEAHIAKEIRKPNPDKVFKYRICVGPNPNPTTNCLDPDVDVWPF